MKKDIDLNTLYSCSPWAIWRHVRTESLGFWFVCGYLFFEYVRPQTIYPQLDVFPWTQALIILSLFWALIVDRNIKPSGNGLNKLLIIYGIVVIISSAFAIWPSIAFENPDVYFNWLIIYFAIVLTVNTRKRFFIFMLLYLLCNFKMSQHGFLSWAKRGFSFAAWGVTGAPGWFRNSGEFGIELTIYTPMVLTFILALKPQWNKLVKIIFYLMPITAIGSTVATSSRGALIGLIAAMLWLLKASKYLIRTIFALVIIGSLTYWFIPDQFIARFETAGEDRTSLHRLNMWEDAWNTILQNPFFGVGHKNWEVYFRSNPDFEQRGSAMTHNIFLQSGTEHGLIGMFTLIMIFIFMFILNSRTRKYANEHEMRFEYFMSYGMDAAIVGMIISASFVTVLYYPYVWIHAALVACLYNTSCRPGLQNGQH